MIHGDDDQIIPHAAAQRWPSRRAGARRLEGAGHKPQARDPVKVNHLMRDFVDPAAPRRSAGHAASRGRKRALYISSPIGLGHAQRDVAIARRAAAARTRTSRSTGWPSTR